MDANRKYLPTTFGITQEQLARAYPSSIDLRPSFPPVQDQGDMNACTGFAVAGALEYLENFYKQELVPLSQQFVYYNERVLEDDVESDDGATLEDGLVVVSKYGACALSLCPYDKSTLYKKPSEEAYADGATRKNIVREAIEQTQDSLLTMLASNIPVIFGMLVFESFESEEVARTGVVNLPTAKEEFLGGHALLIVGYDLPSQFFWVRNSWGPHWGIDGYFKLPFSYALNSSLASSFYAVTSMTLA